MAETERIRHVNGKDDSTACREIDHVRVTLTAEIRHLRELLDQRDTTLRTALDLQATEYTRRLLELNHAHDHAMENWARSLPRELFEQFSVEHNKWKEGVVTQLPNISSTSTALTVCFGRVDALEKFQAKILGALILVGFLGLAGVAALIKAFSQ